MDKRFDFNLLTIFLEVYQLRSITLAADSLGLTQPGVSGAIKRLQKHLAVELFVREGRGISPTNVAIQLACQISPAFNMVNSALSNVVGFDKQTPRAFIVYINEPMMNLLQPLVENDPDMGKCEIKFQLTPNDENQLLHQLSLQKADLAIDIGPLPSPSYSNELFYREDVVMVCRKGHPRITGNITQEQFYNEKHITLKVRRLDLSALDYFTEDIIAERQKSCECHSLIAMMTLISESNCIGITSSSMADKYAQALNLQRMALPFQIKPVLHKMMWHKRNEFHPAHIWLRNKLHALIQSIKP